MNYKLQKQKPNRFNIQTLTEDGEWFTYKFSYIKPLEELILYLENWLVYNPRTKYRIIDYKTGYVVYE